ncbi:MAG: alpha/beta fold hydrolase [Deltaproteobacteria bacterium]|nr:alpha/beta fold hydrolase [Deltaproteobacteria bacterium]
MCEERPATARAVTKKPIRGIELDLDDSGGNGPPVVFSHGLLWSGRMFDAQVRALQPDFRTITYDHRGQGRSDRPRGTVSIETVYEDAVALIESLGVAPCHFVGLSMGGFVGIRLASRRPDLLRSLSLLGTTAGPEPRHNVPKYLAMNAIARGGGLRLVAPAVMKIMFGKTFLEDPAREPERRRWTDELLSNHRSIHRAVAGVIEREGAEELARQIRVRTLIVVGDEDVATPPSASERLNDLIEGSRLERVRGAGHTSTVEQPEQLSKLVREFVSSVG